MIGRATFRARIEVQGGCSQAAVRLRLPGSDPRFYRAGDEADGGRDKLVGFLPAIAEATQFLIVPSISDMNFTSTSPKTIWFSGTP